MCGIFGYSGSEPVNPLKLKFLAAENEARGSDSVGIYGNYLVKDNTSARNFIINTDLDDVLDGAKTVIGHTRKATTGAKTKVNAHPFEIGEDVNAVVGTHNGWIFDEVVKKVSEAHGIKVPDVDSQLVYELLAKESFNYDVLSELEGTMALAFIRKIFPNILYLYRRPSKPLHIGYDNGGIYYSSEDTPLWLIGCSSVQEIETDSLHVFRNGALLEVSDVKKPSITSITLDEGLTSWRAKASIADLKTAGLYATSQRTETAGGAATATVMGGGSGKQRYLPLLQKTPREDGKILTLDKLPASFYNSVTIKEPDKGKFVYCGNHNVCYYLLKLVDSHTNTELIGWTVTTVANPTINGVSCHNGVLALQFPSNMCGDPVALSIQHPIYPDKVFKTSINPKEGRIMEVVLSIPFLREEEKEKEDSRSIIRLPSYPESRLQRSGLFDEASLFSEINEDSSVIGGDEEGLHGRWSTESEELQAGSSEQVGFIGTNKRLFSFRSLDGWFKEINTDFNQENDILDMDGYTSHVTSDEVKSLRTKCKESLSSVGLDDEVKSTFLKVENFLEFLDCYLDNRLKHLKQLYGENGEGES